MSAQGFRQGNICLNEDAPCRSSLYKRPGFVVSVRNYILFPIAALMEEFTRFLRIDLLLLTFWRTDSPPVSYKLSCLIL